MWPNFPTSSHFLSVIASFAASLPLLMGGGAAEGEKFAFRIPPSAQLKHLQWPLAIQAAHGFLTAGIDFCAQRPKMPPPTHFSLPGPT